MKRQAAPSHFWAKMLICVWLYSTSWRIKTTLVNKGHCCDYTVHILNFTGYIFMFFLTNCEFFWSLFLWLSISHQISCLCNSGKQGKRKQALPSFKNMHATRRDYRWSSSMESAWSRVCLAVFQDSTCMLSWLSRILILATVWDKLRRYFLLWNSGGMVEWYLI